MGKKKDASGAKTKEEYDITTVAGRKAIPPSDSFHWQTLGTYRQLGYRKLREDSEGTWTAKCTNPAVWTEKSPPKHPLGTLDQIPGKSRFNEAKELAEKWFAHLGLGGSTKSCTVREACAAYVDYVRSSKGDAQANDLAGRYRRWVDDDPIGRIELKNLTQPNVKAWKARLEKTKALVTRNHSGEKVTRDRHRGTVNRDMTALRAALNHALDDKMVTSDQAWKTALKPYAGVDGQRKLYLDRAQRRALLAHAADDVGMYLRGLTLLPFRPGALAHLFVEHFEPRLSQLIVGKDKNGEPRAIELPPKTAAFFAELCKDRPQDAPIFTRADGLQWNKDAWKDPIKEAVRAAGLPASATAYTLRHSVITDLVLSGVELLTIANLAGTSAKMIEKHYWHLRQKAATEALATLDLDADAPPLPPPPPAVDYGDADQI